MEVTELTELQFLQHPVLEVVVL